MKNKTLENKLRIGVLISLIVTIVLVGIGITAIFAYRNLVIQPKQEKAKLDLEEKIAKDEFELKERDQLSDLWEQTVAETETERQLEARELCSEQAKQHAIDLLKTKVELSESKFYEEAAKKDLFLVDDYNTSYENCLSVEGIKK